MTEQQVVKEFRPREWGVKTDAGSYEVHYVATTVELTDCFPYEVLHLMHVDALTYDEAHTLGTALRDRGHWAIIARMHPAWRTR